VRENRRAQYRALEEIAMRMLRLLQLKVNPSLLYYHSADTFDLKDIDPQSVRIEDARKPADTPSGLSNHGIARTDKEQLSSCKQLMRNRRFITTLKAG
jgi:hypothetical protein